MRIKILLNDAVHKKIQDKTFCQQWANLATQVKPRMLTQEYEFVSSWYHSYQDRYNPMFILGYQGNEIIGILPLTILKENGCILHAGAGQAEYHGWIASPENEVDFLVNSLIAVKQQLSIKRWQWTWLPPNANTTWLHEKRLRDHGIYINSVYCNSPIYDLTDSRRINKIKKHRSLKAMMNRLKRGGELKIERITNKAYANELFDYMENQNNFRKLAMYNYKPFEADTDKRNWFLSRIGSTDNLQFMILWQGKNVLACSVAHCFDDTMVGIQFSYDPVQSLNSPGNVFFIMYIEYLIQKGFKCLDLTPGGEVYKERFCNAHNALIKPNICFDYSTHLQKKTISVTKEYLKNKLTGKHYNRKIQTLKSLKDKNMLAVLKYMIQSKKAENEQLFTYIRKKSIQSTATYPVNCHEYADLLQYQNNNGYLLATEVVSQALRQFSRGDTLYTIVVDGELLLFAWLAIAGKKHWDASISQCLSESKHNCVIYDIYLNPKHKYTEVLPSFLSHIKYEFSKQYHKNIYLMKPLEIQSAFLIEQGFKQK